MFQASACDTDWVTHQADAMIYGIAMQRRCWFSDRWIEESVPLEDLFPQRAIRGPGY